MWAAPFWGGKAANMYQLKALAYSAKTSPVRPDIARTIKDEVAATNEEGRRLMDQLLTTPGYVFLLMAWGWYWFARYYNAEVEKWQYFLYDPNCAAYLSMRGRNQAFMRSSSNMHARRVKFFVIMI